MIVKVKYHDKTLPKLKKNPVGDWIDLRAAEDVEIKEGEFKLISLGISVELPVGYEAVIASRSSTFKNFHGIMCNGIGIIDNSYNSDSDVWKYGMYAMTDTIIHKGDRICQFRIQKNQPDFEFIEVECLNNESRGGFGSTGTR